MIDSLSGYTSPSMITEPAIRDSLNEFIARTLEGFSTPGSDVAKYFASPDVAISGSGWTSTSWVLTRHEAVSQG